MKLSNFHSVSLCCLVMILALAGCSNQSNDKKKPDNKSATKQVMADAVVVSASTLENTISTNGTLLPAEEVELRSELPGRIVGINFHEGSQVGKGDLLVKIDDRELQAQLAKLRLDEKLAGEDVFRKQKLLEINAVSREEYDKAVNQQEIVKANISLLNAQISKTEIRAPFTGIVGLRQVSEGGYISTSTLIAKLQQVDPVKLEFAVPEKYRQNLKPGTKVNFTVDGSETQFTAAVYAIEPASDPLTHSIKLRAVCANPGKVLLPGAFARITIGLHKLNNAIMLPAEAIIPNLNGQKVLVCQNGKVVSQQVETGIRSEKQIQITSGINVGDTVFISGLLVLKDKMEALPRIVNLQSIDSTGTK